MSSQEQSTDNSDSLASATPAAQSAEAVVFNIQRLCVHDGPGIRTVVYVKGCPLTCSWCHNPESWDAAPQLLWSKELCLGCGRCSEVCEQQCFSVEKDTLQRMWRSESCSACGTCADACPSGALQLAGELMTPQQAFDVAERDRTFYEESGGGVTISGGEPLASVGFTEALLSLCRQGSIHTNIQTSLFAPWQAIARLLPFLDYCQADLKVMDPAVHCSLTGVSNELILENLARLAETDIKLNVRIPIVPGCTDGESQLADIARFVQTLKHTPQVELLAYHELGQGKLVRMGSCRNCDDIVGPSDERMQELCRLFADRGVAVRYAEKLR